MCAARAGKDLRFPHARLGSSSIERRITCITQFARCSGGAMEARKMQFLPLVLLIICIPSYPQDTSTSYETLVGNWQLAGEKILTQGPLFSSLTLGIDGSMVYGKGVIAPNCPSGKAGAFGFVVSGEIDSDGSFVLSDYLSRLIQLEIRGEVPRNGKKTWTGSFTYNDSRREGCGISGDFVATQFPQLNGTYSGTLTGEAPDSGVTVSIKMAQERLRPNYQENPSGPFSHYTPLSGEIALTGYPGFASGTTVVSPECQIGGVGFLVSFPMKDGSKMVLSGAISDMTASSLEVQLFTVGNRRSFLRAGSLTRVASTDSDH